VTASTSLRDSDQRLRPDHFAAEFDQPIEQHLLGRGLRKRQRVRVVGRQHAEIDSDQRPSAVPDSEPGRLNAFLHEAPCHVEVFEDFQRAGIDRNGTRRVGARGQPVDDRGMDVTGGQRGAQGEPGGSGPHHEDIGVIHLRLLRPKCQHSLAKFHVAPHCDRSQRLLAYTCWHG
jgi:hypothetical protein